MYNYDDQPCLHKLSFFAVQIYDISYIHLNANLYHVNIRYILHGRMQTAKILLLVPDGMNTLTAASVCKDVCKITTKYTSKTGD